MRESIRVAGVGGLVLFLFGLVSYGLTGTFDLWTAVHVVGGGVLLLLAVAANLAGFRRTVAARGTRERAQAVGGTALFAAVLVTLNVAAGRSTWTWDATEQKIHTLSEKSRAVVGGLDAPVEVFVFLPTGDRSRDTLEELLTRFAALSSKLNWRFVDAEVEPQIADQLGVRRQSVVVARSGEATAQSPIDEASGISEGEIVRLVLKVSRPTPRVVYVLTGHGEPAVDDLDTPAGLGVLARALAEDNFQVRPLLLSAAPAVPDDATVVIVASPVKPLLAHESDQLKAWLARGGRLLALVDPGADASLDPVWAEFEIKVGDDLIIDQEEIPFLGARLGLDPIIDDFPPHPITKSFRERIVLSQARSVTPLDPGTTQGIRPTVIARTRAMAWAESGWRNVLATGRVAGPPEAGPASVSVGVAAMREADGARVVVVGDSDWVRNGWIGNYFNREFLVNIAEWLAGSEELIAEPPKGFRASRLDMTEADYRTLFRFGVLLLPEALLIVGLAFWLRRLSL